MKKQYDIDMSYIQLAHQYEYYFHKLNDAQKKGYLGAVIRVYGKELLEGEFLLAAQTLLPEQFNTSQNTNCSSIFRFNQILFGTLIIMGNVLKYTTAVSNHNNQISTLHKYSVGKFGDLIIPTGNKIHDTTFTELFNKTATHFELLFGHNITQGITPISAVVLFDSAIVSDGLYSGSCSVTSSSTYINGRVSTQNNITINGRVRIRDINSSDWKHIVAHEFTHLIINGIFKCSDISSFINEGIAYVNGIITSTTALQYKYLPLYSDCTYNLGLMNQYTNIQNLISNPPRYYAIQGSFIIYLINEHPEIFYKWLYTRGNLNEVIKQCDLDTFKQWFYTHCVTHSIVLLNDEQFTIVKSNTKFITTPKTITNNPSQYSNTNKIFVFNQATHQYEILRCNTTDQENSFKCEIISDWKIAEDYCTIVFGHNYQGHDYLDLIIKRLNVDQGFRVQFISENSTLVCIDHGQKSFIPDRINTHIGDVIKYAKNLIWDMSSLYKDLKESNVCQKITTKYINQNFTYTIKPLFNASNQTYYNVILNEQSYDNIHTNNNTNTLNIYPDLLLIGIGTVVVLAVGITAGICYTKRIRSKEQHEPQDSVREADDIPLHPLTSTSDNQTLHQVFNDDYKSQVDHKQKVHQLRIEKMRCQYKQQQDYQKILNTDIKLTQQDELYNLKEEIQNVQDTDNYKLQVIGHTQEPDAPSEEF